ncbi:MAG: GNAT family N-acetyltransferase [Anaerolineae bacterium]
MDIRLIEERSLNALPSLYTMVYDGWILRFAKGYTRRANSVNPLYGGTLPLNEKIDYCEDVYRRHGLNVIFKLTDAAQPAELEDVLVARGYEHQAGTIVETMDLTKVRFKRDANVVAQRQFTMTWFNAFAELNGLREDAAGTLKKILAQIQPRTCFASFVDEGQVVATGMAVLERGCVGLFDIVTDVNHRRKGYSTRLVSHLLAWAQEKGGHTAYLQVVGDNQPALWMYNKIGFKETYHYWYRVKS